MERFSAEDSCTCQATAGPKETQQRIPDTYDPIPKEVQEAADEYVEAKREVAGLREKRRGNR